MNKLLNIIFDDIRKDKSIYISLIAVIIISLIFGMLFITILSSGDKLTITNYINDYFESINTSTYKLNIYNNLLNNNLTLIIIWILGFSLIGIPLLIILLFYKGFSISFTITSLLYNFKLKGILYSIIYTFPHIFLNLLIYFITTYYSFKLSLLLFNNIFHKTNIQLKTYIKKYIFILLISIVILSISSLFETYIMPLLLKLVL